MKGSRPIHPDTVRAVVDALFTKGPPTVAEAYSAFGQPLRYFRDAEDVAKLAAATAKRAPGTLHLAVHYPDTAGRLEVRRIALDPSKCDGHDHRFRCEGWGLIWVYLDLASSPKLGSFISANSEKRAVAWSDTYPDMDRPDTWNWPAVASHLRRLRRVLQNGGDKYRVRPARKSHG